MFHSRRSSLSLTLSEMAVFLMRWFNCSLLALHVTCISTIITEMESTHFIPSHSSSSSSSFSLLLLLSFLVFFFSFLAQVFSPPLAVLTSVIFLAFPSSFSSLAGLRACGVGAGLNSGVPVFVCVTSCEVSDSCPTQATTKSWRVLVEVLVASPKGWIAEKIEC